MYVRTLRQYFDAGRARRISDFYRVMEAGREKAGLMSVVFFFFFLLIFNFLVVRTSLVGLRANQ